MSTNQLYLLADHIKLSLLERQRAQTLNLPGKEKQDAQLKRSLDQFKAGLEGLEEEEGRLRDGGDAEAAAALADSVSVLHKQFDDLTAQFHGFASPAQNEPNDPSLSPEFAHAKQQPQLSRSQQQQQQPRKTALRTPSGGVQTTGSGGGSDSSPPKTVRFSEQRAPSIDDDDQVAASAALFGRTVSSSSRAQPYRDDPDAPVGYSDHIAAQGLDNVQIQAYHTQVLAEQDAQLDALGASIGRQRELSMRIGDELDEQVAMLEDVEGLTDRHQGRLDQAGRRMGTVIRKARENGSVVVIVVLILVLVILIAIK